MNSPVHIALAANHRYAKGLRATLVSMVSACHEPTRLRFHVFSDGLTAEDKAELVVLADRFGYREPIDFREPDMKPIAERFSAYYGTHTTFIRVFFPTTLPELDWVLWADVDTLWFRDPIELWNEREATVSVIWSEDLPSTKRMAGTWHRRVDADFNHHPYCCAGVMVLNLKLLRETGFIRKALALADEFGTPPFADQGIFNALCWENAKIVDDAWDLVRPTANIRRGIVLHFNGMGRLFNDETYTGWRPLYEIWFRYRAEVVNGLRRASVWPLWKRTLFTFLGFLRPATPLLRGLPLRPWHRDNIRRTIFFAWLRGRKLW